jgi:hypothetical protein
MTDSDSCNWSPACRRPSGDTQVMTYNKHYDRMEAVDHTHPAQDAVADAYRRGRGADDGLRADGEGSDTDTDADTDASDTMRDVSHKPADSDGTNRVWARGDTDQPVRDDDE